MVREIFMSKLLELAEARLPLKGVGVRRGQNRKLVSLPVSFKLNFGDFVVSDEERRLREEKETLVQRVQIAVLGLVRAPDGETTVRTDE